MYNEVRAFIENKPGKLSHMLEVLAKAEIDILAMEIADEGRFGVVKFLTAEPERAKQMLADANFAVVLNLVVVIEIPDKPGGLVSLSKALESVNLNVTDAYGCILERGKRAIFVVKGDNLEAIEAAVQNAGLKILDTLR